MSGEASASATTTGTTTDELENFFACLENMPKTSNGAHSYYMAMRTQDLKLSPVKAKFPTSTIFCTTYDNMKNHAGFFLWKKHPHALVMYEVLDAPWKSKKEMNTFLSKKSPLLTAYIQELIKVSRVPDPSVVMKNEEVDQGKTNPQLDSWDPFLSVKVSKKRQKKKKNRASQHQQLKQASMFGGGGNGSYGAITFAHKGRPLLPKGVSLGEIDQALGVDPKKRERKEKITKYFICIKSGAGPLFDRAMKQSLSEADFDVSKFLSLSHDACKVSVQNANRIAFAIADLCDLKIQSAFEDPNYISPHDGRLKSSRVPAPGKSTLEIPPPYAKFTPLKIGLPSFVQLYNTTVAVADDGGEDKNRPQGEQWVASFNGVLNGKETGGFNRGRVAVYVQSLNRYVTVPVDLNHHFSNILVPTTVKNMVELDQRKELMRATYPSRGDIKLLLTSSPNSTATITQKEKKEPRFLKSYTLRDMALDKIVQSDSQEESSTSSPSSSSSSSSLE